MYIVKRSFANNTCSICIPKLPSDDLQFCYQKYFRGRQWCHVNKNTSMEGGVAPARAKVKIKVKCSSFYILTQHAYIGNGKDLCFILQQVTGQLRGRQIAADIACFMMPVFVSLTLDCATVKPLAGFLQCNGG